MFKEGQGVLGRIRFTDGQFPDKNRTYLIVHVAADEIHVLNVSSLAGKEHKLLFRHNREITNYNPPFRKKSFVKLDSLAYVDIAETSDLLILSNGQTLDAKELNDIVQAIVK